MLVLLKLYTLTLEVCCAIFDACIIIMTTNNCLFLTGIIPLVAKELHSARIHSVARNALTQSGLLSSNVPIASFANTSGEFNSKMASLPLPLDSSELNALSKLSVIGVTTRPGLHPCLFVGVNFANRCLATLVSRSADTPSLFPVHHMRAHALTARLLEHSLRFPFLCLLVSGGHALLAFVRGPRAADFELLGDCADVAPGQVLDKVARRLKLKNLPGLHSLTGGAQVFTFCKILNFSITTYVIFMN